MYIIELDIIKKLTVQAPPPLCRTDRTVATNANFHNMNVVAPDGEPEANETLGESKAECNIYGKNICVDFCQNTKHDSRKIVTRTNSVVEFWSFIFSQNE